MGACSQHFMSGMSEGNAPFLRTQFDGQQKRGRAKGFVKGCSPKMQRCAGAESKDPHRELGMVDLKSKKCVCGRAQPSFGLPGHKIRTRCAKCRETGNAYLRRPFTEEAPILLSVFFNPKARVSPSFLMTMVTSSSKDFLGKYTNLDSLNVNGG